MSGELPGVKIKNDHPELPGYLIINESDFDPAKHERFVEPLAELPPLPPAELPPIVDPLASLAPDWKSQDAAALKAIALAVSGRSVDNSAQAIDVIEAALAARTAA